ncbi:MAG: S-layer homology domain-containing protein, partial [Firmicutes bacterium]|nr:S-layer homology domain-containing protein [Bacillota bacterium]
MTMTQFRRLFVMIMCVIMTVGAMPVTASAAAQSSQDMHAEVLNELHLMAGTDKGFQLHKKVSRVEAITMLINMMGEGETAKNGTYSHPFTDVPAWANNFVGYAYENKLTSGVAEDRFGSNNDCTQAQYLTFILRSLGYSDAMGEFTWDNPYELAH